MFKLIKLEYRKAQLKTLFFLSLGSLSVLIYWCVFNNGGHAVPYVNYQSAFADIHFYAHTVFLIITSILISRVVLDEYRNLTIRVVFTYPHARPVIMLAKLIFISAFAFFGTLFTAGVIIGVFVYSNPLEHWDIQIFTKEFISLLLFSLSAVGISLVSFFIGMIRKSIAATIIFPILLTSVSSSFYDAKSISMILYMSLAWLLLGSVLAYFCIRNMDQADVE